MKNATTIEEQINLLKSRGMVINDEEKAKEILLDIGYYRLGFYWFPFEVCYPQKNGRDHLFRKDTSFDDVVALHYFDCNLRNRLSPYLYRIEVNFRTYIIYTLSNRYKSNPTWFSDKQVLDRAFLDSLPSTYDGIMKNDVIKFHHIKYPNDIYAPAWKTLEYMTFGNIFTLYKSIKNKDLKRNIANHYNIKNEDVFEGFMNAILIVRNQCAHGHNIYDLNLKKSIKPGPLDEIKKNRAWNNVIGCLYVISYFLSIISEHRNNDMMLELKDLINDDRYRNIHGIIKRFDVFR